jgi:hypothetical protein
MSYTFARCFHEAVKLDMSHFETGSYRPEKFSRAWSVFSEVLGFGSGKVKEGRNSPATVFHAPGPAYMPLWRTSTSKHPTDTNYSPKHTPLPHLAV